MSPIFIPTGELCNNQNEFPWSSVRKVLATTNNRDFLALTTCRQIHFPNFKCTYFCAYGGGAWNIG